MGELGRVAITGSDAATERGGAIVAPLVNCGNCSKTTCEYGDVVE